MKHILLSLLLISFYFNIEISATGMYDSLKDTIISTGRRIEAIDNIPFIDKLTNFLPCAALAASFQQCPGQSFFLIASIIAYALYNSEFIPLTFCPNGAKNSREDNASISYIDDLFVFEGDDEDDAMEQEDNEDELLSNDNKNMRKKYIGPH